MPVPGLYADAAPKKLVEFYSPNALRPSYSPPCWAAGLLVSWYAVCWGRGVPLAADVVVVSGLSDPAGSGNVAWRRRLRSYVQRRRCPFAVFQWPLVRSRTSTKQSGRGRGHHPQAQTHDWQLKYAWPPVKDVLNLRSARSDLIAADPIRPACPRIDCIPVDGERGPRVLLTTTLADDSSSPSPSKKDDVAGASFERQEVSDRLLKIFTEDPCFAAEAKRRIRAETYKTARKAGQAR